MGEKTTSAPLLSKLPEVKAQAYICQKKVCPVARLVERMTAILAKAGVGRVGFTALSAGLTGCPLRQSAWLAFG